MANTKYAKDKSMMNQTSKFEDSYVKEQKQATTLNKSKTVTKKPQYTELDSSDQAASDFSLFRKTRP